MTARERYIQTLTFGNPDKIPLEVGHPRESTLNAWHAQGLPKGVHYLDALYGELGIMRPSDIEKISIGSSFKMIPTFEEKVLEHRDGHYIVQDWMGAITEISDEFDYTYIRSAKDFVTRKWHKFPVESREEFAEMKKRFRADIEGRHADDILERAKKLADRDFVSVVNINGPFWQLREFCGMENLCMMFIDDPEFVEEMVDFWTNFVYDTLKTILASGYVPDSVRFQEDMAYKAHPMISPKMTRDFLSPAYKKWVKLIKSAGVPIVAMDSDGYIADLIPVWIESGINSCDPIEVAAHCDINEFRRMFGKEMAYQGSVDKRAMAKGGITLADEIKRISPVVKDGGFIPSCDHGVPHDISWQNYLETGRLLAKICGWL